MQRRGTTAQGGLAISSKTRKRRMTLTRMSGNRKISMANKMALAMLNKARKEIISKGKKKKEIISLIKNAPALAGAMTDSLAERLVQDGAFRHFEPAELLFDQGEVGSAMYVIDKGKIEILRRNDAEMEEFEQQDGGEQILLNGVKSLDRKKYSTIVKIGKGELFGETALLTEAPRNAAAMAGDNGADCFVIQKHLIPRCIYACDCSVSGCLTLGSLQEMSVQSQDPFVTANG